MAQINIYSVNGIDLIGKGSNEWGSFELYLESVDGQMRLCHNTCGITADFWFLLSQRTIQRILTQYEDVISKLTFTQTRRAEH